MFSFKLKLKQLQLARGQMGKREKPFLKESGGRNGGDGGTEHERSGEDARLHARKAIMLDCTSQK